MDFTFTEEQETIGKVARQLFEHRATPEHLTELEAGDIRYDAALWRELATSDLLGIALPEYVGGSGGGFLELAVLLAEVGWSVAPVPVYATLVLGADTIARHGDSASGSGTSPESSTASPSLTAALAEPGRSDPTAPTTTARRDGDRGASTAARSWCRQRSSRRPSSFPPQTEDGPGLFLLETGATA